MGRRLYQHEPAFRDSIDATGAVVERVLDWAAADRFRFGGEPEPTPEEIARRNEIIHLGMVQIALVDLWRDRGTRPGAVLSVSLGEVVAPYAADAMTRDSLRPFA